MNGAGPDSFDITVRESDVWLNSLMHRLHTDDRHTAYLMLRAALHALRDRIGPQNAVNFGVQLPMLLRGMLIEGWHIASTPTGEHTAQQFLDQARARLPAMLAGGAERGVRATFAVICERIDGGEVRKLVAVLPADLHRLWPDSASRE